LTERFQIGIGERLSGIGDGFLDSLDLDEMEVLVDNILNGFDAVSPYLTNTVMLVGEIINSTSEVANVVLPEVNKLVEEFMKAIGQSEVMTGEERDTMKEVADVMVDIIGFLTLITSGFAGLNTIAVTTRKQIDSIKEIIEGTEKPVRVIGDLIGGNWATALDNTLSMMMSIREEAERINEEANNQARTEGIAEFRDDRSRRLIETLKEGDDYKKLLEQVESGAIKTKQELGDAAAEFLENRSSVISTLSSEQRQEFLKSLDNKFVSNAKDREDDKIASGGPATGDSGKDREKILKERQEQRDRWAREKEFQKGFFGEKAIAERKARREAVKAEGLALDARKKALEDMALASGMNISDAIVDGVRSGSVEEALTDVFYDFLGNLMSQMLNELILKQAMLAVLSIASGGAAQGAGGGGLLSFLPGFADGGIIKAARGTIIKAQPGGTHVLAAEAGVDESFIPNNDSGERLFEQIGHDWFPELMRQPIAEYPVIYGSSRQGTSSDTTPNGSQKRSDPKMPDVNILVQNKDPQGIHAERITRRGSRAKAKVSG